MTMVASFAFALALQARSSPDWLPVLDAPGSLTHELALVAPAKAGPKLEVRGTVFKADGKTPAAGITVYFHHTDARGIYPGRDSGSGWTRWHGTLRGWLKTNAQGQYVLRTTRPAPYPGGTEPAHIHAYGLAAGSRTGFYFEDILFHGDPLISDAYWSRVAVVGTRPYEGLRVQKDSNGVLQGRWDFKMPR
jgi:protocatechuate 3,4-dioxygenase beta subunit